MATNPYLQQMGDAITGTATRNLTQNILPTMRRGAVASGGWGNSGQGIAQGLATEGTQRGITDSLANMYGSAYEGDQNRSNAMGIANLNASTQRDIAAMNDATNRYGLGNSYELGKGNLGLGYAGLDTQRYGMDLNHSLGLGNLGVSQFNADTTRQDVGNRYGLGLMQNDTNRYGMDLNHSLGLGNLNLNYQNSAQDFYSTQREQDMYGQNQGFNQYKDLWNMQLGMGDSVNDIGNQQWGLDWQNQQNYGNGLNPFTGLNDSNSTTTPETGGGIAGAVGGAMTGAQWAKMIYDMYNSGG